MRTAALQLLRCADGGARARSTAAIFLAIVPETQRSISLLGDQVLTRVLSQIPASRERQRVHAGIDDATVAVRQSSDGSPTRSKCTDYSIGPSEAVRPILRQFKTAKRRWCSLALCNSATRCRRCFIGGGRGLRALREVGSGVGGGAPAPRQAPSKSIAAPALRLQQEAG